MACRNSGHSSVVAGRSWSVGASDTARVYRPGPAPLQRVRSDGTGEEDAGMDRKRPIGWWVKQLDAPLEQAVDSAVAGEGATRRHWQVLHSLSTGAVPESELRSALDSFPGGRGAV